MKQKKKKKSLRKPESTAAKNYRLLKKRYPHLWQQLKGFSSSTGIAATEDEKNRILNSTNLFYGNEAPIDSVNGLICSWAFHPYDVVFLIGMGLGYLPIEALKRDIGCPRMVIIEPSVQIFQDALKINEFDVILRDERIDLYVGNTVPVSEIIDRCKEIIPIGKCPVIVHPNYEAIFKEHIPQLKTELVDRIREVKDAWFTIREHGQLMFKNTIANLPSLFAGTPMRELRGKCEGLTAVCVSAGPSLDETLERLKEFKNKVVIIACDSAVGPLLSAGITPHFVVTVDIFKTNIEKLKPYFNALRETVLIFGLESNPDNVRLFLGQRRVGVSAFSKLMSFWLEPQLKLKSLLPEMSSVAHLALFAALAMGAKPIVMAGMDFAFIEGKSHSFGSAFFRSLDNNDSIPIYGNDGSTLPSSGSFVADRLLIENIAHSERMRLVNTSIKGAYVEGTTIRRMNEVMDLAAADATDVEAVLKHINWTTAAEASTAASELTMFIRLLDGVRIKCSQHMRETADAVSNIDAHNDNCSLSRILKDCTKHEKAYDSFEQQHLPYKSMIKEIMLADLEEIAKQREVLSSKQDENDLESITGRMQLIHREFYVFDRGLEFHIQEIKPIIAYLQSTSKLKIHNDHPADKWQILSQLACIHRQSGQLWQAEQVYRECMELNPDDPAPYAELAQAYIDAKLLSPAQNLGLHAQSQLGDLSKNQEIVSNVELAIKALFEEMKKEWMQGNMHSTRKLLAEYLTLRPDDPQANELKSVIGELDREFAEEWEENHKPEKGDVSMRFQKVVALVKKKQLEKGIGILEGLFEELSDERAIIREQIGDIRMMQKDFQSAWWNYQQAIQLDPQKVEIGAKMERARSLAG